MKNIEQIIGRIYSRVRSRSDNARWLFFLTGIVSTVWFIVRVIPKPSRSSYPCMRAAAPIMSTFVIYILGLTGSATLVRKASRKWRKGRYVLSLAMAVSALIILIITTFQQPSSTFANATTLMEPNVPVGTPRGCIPGRVTWMWNTDATNEKAKINDINDAYFLPGNTSREVVQEMVDQSILYLTGQETIPEAWQELFRYFNRTHGKGETGYAPGEKIFIKMNLVGQWSLDSTSYDMADGNFRTGHTTPQSVMALLNHLVNVAGIDQGDISVGDPIQQFPQQYYDIIAAEYSGVHYISSTGNLGRTRSVPGSDTVLFYSDRGAVLREGDPDSWGNADMGDPVTGDVLYTVIREADYLINIANLKGHERAGISLCAKNHFGSLGRTYAKQLHMGLVHPDQFPNEISRDIYGEYRVLVDLMGHEKLGGNTLLFVLDALYSSPGAGSTVVKSASLGNDWMSSIFMSQDHVAIESVGLDFARMEYQEAYQDKTFPQYNAVEDYLLQAADPSFWPEGIVYDPENDGTPLGSLGVYETWNNPVDKEYAGNLGTAAGIELIKVHEEIQSIGIGRPQVIEDAELSLRPNPFRDRLTISLVLQGEAEVILEVYDLSGRLVTRIIETHARGAMEATWDGTHEGRRLPEGLYLIVATFSSVKEARSESRLVQLLN